MRCLVTRSLVPVLLALTLAMPTHASAEHSTHRHWSQLIHDINSFGYWVTYFARQNGVPQSRVASAATVNGHVAQYIGSVEPSTWPAPRRAGALSGRMHLMNIPSAYRYHIDSYTDSRAVVTMHWLFGSTPHTPIARLTWTFAPSGWSISTATFAGDS